MKIKNKTLRSLGKKKLIPDKPKPSILDKVINPKMNVKYCIRLTCPEFTSVCPITSQPDFALLVIDYIPSKYIVESKSFKLYLHSYRNHGSFHEDCTISIAEDLMKLLKPNWLRIAGFWFPRGGIPIDIFWQSKKQPLGTYIPSLDEKNYSGRN